jgi:hypothetical protein
VLPFRRRSLQQKQLALARSEDAHDRYLRKNSRPTVAAVYRSCVLRCAKRDFVSDLKPARMSGFRRRRAVPAPVQIIRKSGLTIPQIRTIFRFSPRHHEGRSRESSRNVVRVAMAAAGVRCFVHQAKRWQRTVKSCGPGAATLASIPPPGGGVATVTIKAAHRGEYV